MVSNISPGLVPQGGGERSFIDNQEVTEVQRPCVRLLLSGNTTLVWALGAQQAYDESENYTPTLRLAMWHALAGTRGRINIQLSVPIT